MNKSHEMMTLSGQNDIHRDRILLSLCSVRGSLGVSIVAGGRKML